MVEYGERYKGEAAAFGFNLEKVGSLLCFFHRNKHDVIFEVHNCPMKTVDFLKPPFSLVLWKIGPINTVYYTILNILNVILAKMKTRVFHNA